MEVAKKAKQSDIGTINNIINEVFPMISTSFSTSEMLGYAANFMKYNIADTSGFPFERGTGTMGKRGSCVIPNNLAANVKELHQFLFGEEAAEYMPSPTVQEISDKIAAEAANYSISF